MIGRKSRDSLAELMRHLIAGVITNDQFEGRLPESTDPAIFEIYWNGAWGLYDDMHEHRMTGRWYIRRGSRSDLSRAILFLKGDLRYEWPAYPPRPRLLAMILSLVTLGYANRLMLQSWRRHGDFTVWPFIQREDYERALALPPYLARAS
jgi:hypothetical protein